jgi:hypothetical protein
MKAYKVGLLIVGLAALTTFASWGFLVHRTINQLAVYQLPKEMQPFFHSNMEYIVRNSVAPDQRRNSDSLEETRHFIDFEVFGDSAAWKMPTDWNAAVQKYSKDTLLKYGYVPYHIMVMKDRLTNAFRSKNKDSILFYAADLAHYISDAHVPLHTSINYDGQMTGQKGLHSLWESTVPEIHINEYNLSTSHKARYLSNPSQALWEALRHSHALLPDMLQQEREASKLFTEETKYRVQMRDGRESKRYSSEFAKEYSKRLGNTINDQLLRSTELVADFWYTSWVDAGKPDLSKLFQPAADQQQRIEQELKSFETNKLIENKQLMSRQRNPQE